MWGRRTGDCCLRLRTVLSKGYEEVPTKRYVARTLQRGVFRLQEQNAVRRHEIDCVGRRMCFVRLSNQAKKL